VKSLLQRLPVVKQPQAAVVNRYQDRARFASGQIFDKPFSMGNQSSKPFNQLEPKVQENIIYMINNNGSLPPGNDDIPNMSLNEVNKLRMQQ
jgi:hypothetical protein